MVSGLNQGSAAVAGFQNKVAGSTKAVTGALGTAIPLSAAAAGFAVGKFALDSFKAARDFDAAFTRIGAISNAASSDIERWREDVLDLSGETARAPAELADALFFLSSAGLETNEVMEALDASARAAAAGLGSTVDIANVTASALNAYSKSGLTAAQVTDTLVAAVREGRAEPEEFAAALGKVLPIASQAGVTFDQVTASLAALSNIGLDVSEGTTALRGVLQAIVAPGSMAAEAMDSIGLSAQDLLDAISDQGLLGALRLLDKTAKANTTTQAEYIGTLRAVVPNVRALTGVLGLTGQEAAKVQAIYDSVANATGSLGEAFATTAESDAFKLQKALNDISIEGQRLAASALPQLAAMFTTLVPFIASVARNLDVLIGILIAFKVGSMAAAAGATAFGAALGPIALLIGAATTAGRELNEALFANDLTYEGLAATLNDTVTRAYEAGRLSVEKFLAATRAIERGDLASDELEAAAEEAFRYEAGLAELDAAQNAYVAGAAPVITNTSRVAAAHRDAADAAREQRTAELALAGGFLGVVANAKQLADAQNEVNRLQRLGRTDTQKYRDASFELLTQSVSLRSSLVDYGAELAEQGESHGAVIETLRSLGRQYGLQKGDIRDVIGEVEDLIGKYGDVPDRVRTDVRADTSQAMTALDALHLELDHLQGTTTYADVWVRTHGGSTGFHLLEMLRDALDSFGDSSWFADVEVRAGGMDAHAAGKDFGLKFIEGLQGGLRDLVETIRTAAEGLEGKELRLAEAFRATWLDQAKAFRLQAKELEALVSTAERNLQRIQERARRFGDEIRSGFDFDLIGGAMDLGEVLKAQQIAVLEAQLEAAQAAETPDQAWVDSLNAQIEALRDALIQPTAAQFGAFLQDQLATAQRFAAGLLSLQEAGLSRGLLADLAGQGPGALPFIEALLAGGQDVISQFNQTQATIDQIAGATTDHLVNEVFGKAIEAASRELERAERQVQRFASSIERFVEGLRADAVRSEVSGVIESLRGLRRALDHVSGGGGGTDNDGAGAGRANSFRGPEGVVPPGGGFGGLDYEALARAIAREIGKLPPRDVPVAGFASGVLDVIGRAGSGRAPR